MKNLSAFLLLFLFLTGVSFPQSDTISTTLSEIVVTANRTETPYYTLASSVSVLTSQELQSKQINTVEDALRELPGVTVVDQGGPGKIASVYIRGANPNHTLVLIDGTELNDPSSINNAFDFSFLNTNDIDKIEVVRGPQSTLYGSDAVAGVINIITKFGGAGNNFSFYGESGSNSYYRGNLSANGSYNILNYFVSLSRNSTKGISAADSKFGNTERDGYSNNSFTGKLSVHPSNNFDIGFLYKYTKAKTDLDQNEKLGDDPNFTYDIEEQIFSSSGHLNLFNDKWNQSLTASLVKRFSKAIDLPDQIRPTTSSDSYADAERFKIDWQNNLRFVNNNLFTFGIETEKEKAFTSFVSNSSYGPYENVFPMQNIGTTGLYAQDQINFSNKFFTSLGIRYDNNQKFGSVTTFRIAQAYYINRTSTKLKATYGTGFKAPSLFYLFDPAFGNPDLKPEKSKGWDLGVEQFFNNGKIQLGITYFNLQLTDMFGFGPDFKEINIAKASSEGVEFNFTSNNFNNFNWSLNYTYTNAKDKYAGSEDYNKPLIRRPLHQAFLNLGYKIAKNYNVGMQIKYVGESEDKDFNTYPTQRVKLDAHTLVNLYASIKIFSNIELSGKIENLFDTQYEEILYYGTLGRSFYLGMGITL